MKQIRKIIEKNYFANDLLKRTLLSRQNKKVNGVIAQVENIDSIFNFNEFRQAVKEIKSFKGGIVFTVKRSYSESILYGHLNAIKNYACMNEKDIKYFPIMEHGVDFWEEVNISPVSRICQGRYLFEKWHNTHNGVPIFAIGPYIHYANDYYSTEELSDIKKKIGKTVLVMPAHTHEMSKQEYDIKKFVDFIMDEFSKEYDTIMICAYWADLNYDLYQMFIDAGAMVVSAGFRGDFNFISRLKAIISISDFVIGNDLGTFVGYAAYMHKPVALLKNDIKYEFLDLGSDADKNENYLNNIKLFYKYFSYNAEYKNEEKQNEINDLFWGISQIKSKQELKDILYINKVILKKSHGQIKSIPVVVHKLLNSDALSGNQKKILAESV